MVWGDHPAGYRARQVGALESAVSSHPPLSWDLKRPRSGGHPAAPAHSYSAGGRVTDLERTSPAWQKRLGLPALPSQRSSLFHVRTERSCTAQTFISFQRGSLIHYYPSFCLDQNLVPWFAKWGLVISEGSFQGVHEVKLYS